jgi:nucleotide-binding universal stress UspA family protein
VKTEAMQPGGAEIMSGTIVCGVTEAPDGRSAAQLAAALGQRLGLRLVLVYVVDGVPSGTHESLTARQRQSGAERTLHEIAGKIGNGAEKRVVLGDRAEALAQVAAEEGADLIVLGSRPTGLGGRKLCSTLARELEATTPVPVLVAPPSTRRRSDHRLSVAAEAGAR